MSQERSSQREREEANDAWEDAPAYDLLGDPIEHPRRWGSESSGALEDGTQCPMCGEEVAQNARRCLSCGERLPRTTGEQEDDNEKKRSWPSLTDWIAILFGFGTGLLLGFFYMAYEEPRGVKVTLFSFLGVLSIPLLLLLTAI